MLREFGASISDGVQPIAPLMQASDGNFYGTTTFGGAYGHGAIFKMTPAGELTTCIPSSPPSNVSRHRREPLHVACSSWHSRGEAVVAGQARGADTPGAVNTRSSSVVCDLA